jgi:hypothetical protein
MGSTVAVVAYTGRNMSMPLGRSPRACASTSPWATCCLLASGLVLGACSAEPAPLAPDLTSPSAPFVSPTVPPSPEAPPPALAFRLSLDGVEYDLALERAPESTSPDYLSYRLRGDGALIPSTALATACSYRGRAQPASALEAASAEEAGFAAVSACPSTTGQPVGQALSGIVRANGRFWRLWPDPADTNTADGVDHWVLPVQRKDTPGAEPPSPRLSTLVRAPASAPLQLKYREGTPGETKYVELVLINDAARVAELGGQTEARGIQFVETMNALLEGSGLTPRLRVTLRAQLQFEADPYVPAFAGNEVNHESLMNEFLAWATEQDLPPHDEHVLLSGLDFLGATVGYAGVDAACTARQNGFIVEAGDSGGGFAALSAVHELGHTVGMSHDDGVACSRTEFIMAAVGCANCPRDNQFSPCSLRQFEDYLAGPAYAEGGLCADDVPGAGGFASCGDGVVQPGEACDCGATDCGSIDPCCNGATCRLRDGAQCSDYNDGCCQGCAVVDADAKVVCRAQRSECDFEEVCTGASKSCPADTFEAAGSACEDERGNSGSCYFGDCRSRGTQCEQIAEQQGDNFANVGAPGPSCGAECNRVVCGNGPNGCVSITGPTVADGVPCRGGGQCIDQACVPVVDQCPGDPAKSEPGACGCGTPDADEDSDGAPDCIDACPDDGEKRASGACGCGAPEADTDADGAPDCNDACPADDTKQTPGACGCGAPDVDSDGDAVPDCKDDCPDGTSSTERATCGCGMGPTDTDADGTSDCEDGCPEDGTRDAEPCGASTANAGDAAENGAASLRGSASGSCAVARGSAHPHLGWLLLGVVPFVRRRPKRGVETEAQR